jgi:DMSO/TMAO reductase YedYZ molybdopterin-dependent catalytic subunit
MMKPEPPSERKPGVSRRSLLQGAGGGMLASLLAGCQGSIGTTVDSPESRKARAEKLPDGRPRLPPGQYVLNELRQMGGQPGSADYRSYRLKVYGEVEQPLELTYAELLKLSQTEQTCDIHCVTRWSLLDAQWGGVRVAELAERVKVKPTARHVIFEAAHGYTSNVPLEEALRPTVLAAHHFGGDPLAHDHGGPVRALLPELYFWKSAKWLTAIRFSAVDEPGFWEVRGYHNHGDPWREERYG